MIFACKKDITDQPVQGFNHSSILCTGNSEDTYYPLAIHNAWTFPAISVNSSHFQYIIYRTVDFDSTTYFQIVDSRGYGDIYLRKNMNGDILEYDVAPTTSNLNKITFINPHTAIAVGDSGVILMNLNIITGIENGYLSDDLVSVFPNPSTNDVTFKINAEQQVKFTLYNSLGERQIEKTLTSPTNNINLSAYSSDIYYYTLSNEKRIIKSGKIIKQ